MVGIIFDGVITVFLIANIISNTFQYQDNKITRKSNDQLIELIGINNKTLVKLIREQQENKKQLKELIEQCEYAEPIEEYDSFKVGE